MAFFFNAVKLPMSVSREHGQLIAYLHTQTNPVLEDGAGEFMLGQAIMWLADVD